MLGVLDTERGARTSGSRFVYLMGDLVFVQFALMRHAMDVVVEKGFSPMIPPVLVREDAMYGTGFLPTEAVNLYVTREDELYLVGHVRGAAGRVPPRRDRRGSRPADPVRGVLELLPAGGRFLREGPRRDVPRPPVRQGGDVRVLHARVVLGRTRADPRDRGGDHREPRDPLPGREHRRRRSRRRGGEEVRHRGVAAGDRGGTGSSRPAPTPPTTRRGGCRRACVDPAATSRSSTRSTAPPRRSAAR